MPGWHERTKALQEKGKIRMVGIIQEQHPERARLFMQWKGMDWPILVDSLDLLGVWVVPITFLIDEHGVIRGRNPSRDDLEKFLETRHEPPVEPAARGPRPPRLPALQRSAEEGGDAAAWRAYGDALFLWGGSDRTDDAVDAYGRAAELEPDRAATHFRLGVALRRRFESPDRRPDDFQRAVDRWQAALDGEPNQYIWRRRIQQYGPRLEKPYPFYDWVAIARREIRARGETPAPLPVDPGGAEYAAPARTFEVAAAGRESPDPRDRITHDDGRFIQVETAVVPARVSPGDTARVHVFLRPNLGRKAHWNNEAKDLVVWVGAPEGFDVDQRYLTVANPPKEVSQETRTVEFEVRVPPGAKGESARLPAYALYYVCEDVDGTCLYRRQDLPVEIPIR